MRIKGLKCNRKVYFGILPPDNYRGLGKMPTGRRNELEFIGSTIGATL